MRFVLNFKGLTCIFQALILAQIEKILAGNRKDVALNQKPPLFDIPIDEFTENKKTKRT